MSVSSVREPSTNSPPRNTDRGGNAAVISSESFMSRVLLPNRRYSEIQEIAHNGGRHKLMLSVSFYDDGRLGECFASGSKIGSELESTANDGAILISLLLQNQVSLADIAHSLSISPNGSPASIIGTVVKAMIDWPQSKHAHL